jgi:hypothetical protein
MFRMQRIYGEDAGDLPTGYIGSYRFSRDDFPLSQCHCNRWCTKPTEFIPLSDNETDCPVHYFWRISVGMFRPDIFYEEHK